MDTILVFSCEFCEIDQKSCFTEYIQANASILSTGNNDLFEIVKKISTSICNHLQSVNLALSDPRGISYFASTDNWDRQRSIERHKRKHKEISEKHLNHVTDG